MKFDTIIIGGGLAGLVCGIRLLQQNQRCVIVSSGQSALHFSSGSFDLLNRLPNGDFVDNPLTSIDQLIEQAPQHPYSKLGAEHFRTLVKSSKDFFDNIGFETQGEVSDIHYRITPMGALKRTWLTFSDFAISQSNAELPWKKVALFTIAGFLDFYPLYIVDEFKRLGTECKVHTFNLPSLQHLRRNPSELRSTNIARVMDKKQDMNELVRILSEHSKGCEAIILPACMGLDDPNLISELKQAVGKSIYMIPTLPPSIAGIRAQQYLRHYFQKLGGVYMLGDNVVKAQIENNKVAKVYSFNHGNIPFVGDNVVLATGSYFSQGLIATRDKVYEPIFELDVDYLDDRQEWYNTNVFEAQKYQQFGVNTDNDFRALKNGVAIDNLYVTGAILNGFNPVKEGSGAGVSILSALYVADQILRK